MINPAITISRRNAIIAGLGALVAVPAARAQTPIATTASNQNFLITGKPTRYSRDSIEEVQFWNSALEPVFSFGVDTFLTDFYPTSRPGLLEIKTDFALQFLDLQTGEMTSIDWGRDDFGRPLRTAGVDLGIDMNPDWLVYSNLEMSRVMLIDLNTLEATEISDYIAPSWAMFIPVVPDIPATGSVATLWTGDFVYAIDFTKPEEAIRLIGDDKEWYSSSASLSNDGKWVAFTTYNPETDGDEALVYLMDMESRDYQVIASGSAWTQAFFSPISSDQFFLASPSALEQRSVSSPDEPGKELAPLNAETTFFGWLDGGSRILLGSRKDRDSAIEYTLVDLEHGTSIPLPEVSGKKPFWPDHPQTNPGWLLFEEDSSEVTLQSLIGVDMTTGESWVALEDVYVNQNKGYSASADGRYFSVASMNKGKNLGVWLIDMQDRSFHAFPYADGQFSTSATISADGKIAVGILYQPGSVDSTWVGSTHDPENLTELAGVIPLRWC